MDGNLLAFAIVLAILGIGIIFQEIRLVMADKEIKRLHNIIEGKPEEKK